MEVIDEISGQHEGLRIDDEVVVPFPMGTVVVSRGDLKVLREHVEYGGRGEPVGTFQRGQTGVVLDHRVVERRGYTRFELYKVMTSSCVIGWVPSSYLLRCT